MRSFAKVADRYDNLDCCCKYSGDSCGVLFITGMTLSSYYLGDFAGNYYINGIALAIVSVLNFVSSYKTSNMRTRIATVPTGIVGEYEALTPYVVNLVYNAIFGGLIGIVGSIYGFVIRSYVMKINSIL